MINQNDSKAGIHAYNQVRNALIIQARELLTTYSKVTKNSIRDELLILQGKMEMYVSIRKSLSPNVYLDEYTKEIEGKLNKIKRALKETDK